MQNDPRGLLSHSQAHSAASITSSNTQQSVTSPKSMSTMHHFTEFVKAFCDFGSEMVHLVRLTTSKIFLLTYFYYNQPQIKFEGHFVRICV